MCPGLDDRQQHIKPSYNQCKWTIKTNKMYECQHECHSHKPTQKPGKLAQLKHRHTDEMIPSFRDSVSIWKTPGETSSSFQRLASKLAQSRLFSIAAIAAVEILPSIQTLSIIRNMCFDLKQQSYHHVFSQSITASAFMWPTWEQREHNSVSTLPLLTPYML